jgi:hypothetical protein
MNSNAKGGFSTTEAHAVKSEMPIDSANRKSNLQKPPLRINFFHL